MSEPRDEVVRVSPAERARRWRLVLGVEGEDGANSAAGGEAMPGAVLSADDRRIEDRKSTRLNSSHIPLSRMPSSA